MGSTLSNGSSVASWQNLLRKFDSVLTSWESRRLSFHGRAEWLARSSVTQRLGQSGLGVVDLDRKISAIHATWIRRLVLEGDLPSLYFFKHHQRVAFAGRQVDQILLLTAPSKITLALLPPFYRSVMRAWFRLSRREENGELVIVGSNNYFCPLRSLFVSCISNFLGWIMLRLVVLRNFLSGVWQLTAQLCGQIFTYGDLSVLLETRTG